MEVTEWKSPEWRVPSTLLQISKKVLPMHILYDSITYLCIKRLNMIKKQTVLSIEIVKKVYMAKTEK